MNSAPTQGLELYKKDNACSTKFCHRNFVLKYVVREKKDFQEESGPILQQIGTFCRYLHQNAELLKIMRKHDNPILRREKVHGKNKSLSSKYTYFNL